MPTGSREIHRPRRLVRHCRARTSAGARDDRRPRPVVAAAARRVAGDGRYRIAGSEPAPHRHPRYTSSVRLEVPRGCATRSRLRHLPSGLRRRRLDRRAGRDVALRRRGTVRALARHARAAHRHRPGRRRPGRCVQPAAAGAAGAQHQGARRKRPQGQGRPARRRDARPAYRPDVALPREGPGIARRDPRLQAVGEARHRLPRGRRADGVLPGHGVRPDLPRPIQPAPAHRDGELLAVPPRHARRARRLPGHAPHRRLQDGAQPAHREDVHAGAPRDGASRSTRTATSSWSPPSPRAGRRATPMSARSSTKGRSFRRTRSAPA